MSGWHFIQPLDQLFLRGNRPFGDPGSYGESLVPPWPSVAAGAVRSWLLAIDGVDLRAFSQGSVIHPAVGTPASPGPLRLQEFRLARRREAGNIELLYPLPTDLQVDAGEGPLKRMLPQTLAPGLATSSVLPQLPVLAQSERSKPTTGYWLTTSGWQTYLTGERPAFLDCVRQSDLWKTSLQVGIGLDAETRSASDGALFSMQGLRLESDVGFAVQFAASDTLPDSGMLRFGGDGRAAAITRCTVNSPTVDLGKIVAQRRCRVVLTSAGLFDTGWKLPGTDNDNVVQQPGFQGRVVCVSLPRYEVISGWDLAAHRPKDALRAAPAGAVYWLEDVQTTVEAMQALLRSGLWQPDARASTREAEGFNRFTFAQY